MFFVVWGWRRTVRRLGVVMTACRTCGQGVHSVYREVTKFSLFWVPLFPIRVRYSLLCASCAQAVGASPYPIARSDAERLVATASLR